MPAGDPGREFRGGAAARRPVGAALGGVERERPVSGCTPQSSTRWCKFAAVRGGRSRVSVAAA